MKEFCCYRHSGSTGSTYTEVNFEAQSEQQFVVTHLHGRSSSDDLRIWSSAMDDILGIPSALSTVVAPIGTMSITVDTLLPNNLFGVPAISIGTKVWVKSDKLSTFAQTGYTVQNVVGLTLTLDRPLDFACPVGTKVIRLMSQPIPMFSDGAQGYEIDISAENVGSSAWINTPLVIGLYGTSPKIYVAGYYNDEA